MEPDLDFAYFGVNPLIHSFLSPESIESYSNLLLVSTAIVHVSF